MQPDIDARDSADDAKLDALLGKVPLVMLSAGFADRVVSSVAPAHCTQSGDESTAQASPSKWLRILWATAASVALCGSLIWWNNSPAGPRLSDLTHFSAAPTEEEVLLKALTTLEINSGDLALVAQLGEVLEAELAERTSWLEID